MSEFDKLKGLSNTAPSVSSTAKAVIGAFIGSKIAGKNKGPGFSKRETKNRMIDREHAARVQDELANREHVREMERGQQFHKNTMKQSRFEARNVRNILQNNPNVSEVKSGSHSVKTHKPESKPKSSSKPEASKPMPPSKGKKSGKGKTK